VKRAKPAPRQTVTTPQPSITPQIPPTAPQVAAPAQPSAQIEIVAGNYSKSGAPVATVVNSAPAKRSNPTWQETLTQTTGSAGN
jgi:hypothetical protein